MPLKVEFLFDFGSPNAYLAELAIPAIERRTGLKFEYVPVLLGGIYKATGNMSPFDPRKDQFRQVSVRASEIEQEFYFQGHVDSSRRARCWSGSTVSKLNPSLLSILTVLKTNCQILRNFPVLT